MYDQSYDISNVCATCCANSFQGHMLVVWSTDLEYNGHFRSLMNSIACSMHLLAVWLQWMDYSSLWLLLTRRMAIVWMLHSSQLPSLAPHSTWTGFQTELHTAVVLVMVSLMVICCICLSLTSWNGWLNWSSLVLVFNIVHWLSGLFSTEPFGLFLVFLYCASAVARRWCVDAILLRWLHHITVFGATSTVKNAEFWAALAKRLWNLWHTYIRYTSFLIS